MFGGVAENLDCAIYIRVSTAKQAEEGYGMDLQKSDCRTMAKFRKWNIVETYIDDGYSGTLDIKDRPGLQKLMKDANENKFKVVIIYAIDRLGRDSAIIGGIIKELSNLKIAIVSTKENLDSSTPQGKFVIDLFAGLAEMDRTNIVNRMKKGKDELRKKKGWTGGIPPYGYYYEAKEIRIQTGEAKIVHLIYKYDENGMKAGFIAQELNRQGIPSRMGTKWSRDAVKKILARGETYRGGLINNNENEIHWPKII